MGVQRSLEVMAGESLAKLKVVQLRKRLAELGLPTNGKKAELLKRLEVAINQPVESAAGGGSPEQPAVQPQAQSTAAPREPDATTQSEHTEASQAPKTEADVQVAAEPVDTIIF